MANLSVFGQKVGKVPIILTKFYKIMKKLFYLISTSEIEDDEISIPDMTNEEFAKEAIRQGNVFSSADFEESYNNEWIASSDTMLRIMSADYYKPNAASDFEEN